MTDIKRIGSLIRLKIDQEIFFIPVDNIALLELHETNPSQIVLTLKQTTGNSGLFSFKADLDELIKLIAQ